MEYGAEAGGGSSIGEDGARGRKAVAKAVEGGSSVKVGGWTIS